MTGQERRFCELVAFGISPPEAAISSGLMQSAAEIRAAELMRDEDIAAEIADMKRNFERKAKRALDDLDQIAGQTGG